jgi:hypothetical protein
MDQRVSLGDDVNETDRTRVYSESPLADARRAEHVLHKPLQPDGPTVDGGDHPADLVPIERFEVVEEDLRRRGQGVERGPQLVSDCGE